MFSPKDPRNDKKETSAEHLPPDGERDAGSGERALSITVIFTTVQGTLVALKRAGQLADQLETRIRILVPQVVSFPLPLDRPQVDPLFKVRHLQAHCSRGAVDTRIEVLLCRDARECVKQALSPESLALLGGPRAWGLRRERRLARHLRQSGHQVIFVPQN